MTVFGFQFHLYGLLIALGILTSASISAWLAKRRGISPDLVWNGLWWVVIPALVGARLYHVIDRWGDIYSFDPISIFYVWNGGLGIFGGLVGGIIGLFGYWKWKLPITDNHVPITQLLDLIFFGLPLGQAIGRIGNFVNQEVYGLPSSLPWTIFIDPEHRARGYEQFSRFHPLFAYEAIWCLAGFGIMLSTEKLTVILSSAKERRISLGSFALLRMTLSVIRKNYTGFYLMWYGIGRFLLEFLRIPEFSWRIGQIDIAQILSIMMGIGGYWLLKRQCRTNDD